MKARFLLPTVLGLLASPLFTMRLSRPDLSMDIALLAQETVVGRNSIDGAGVMLTFKAPRL